MRKAILLIVTAEPRSALNAVDEPRYKHPSAATIAVTASCALSGTPSLGWTFAQLIFFVSFNVYCKCEEKHTC